MCLNSCSRISNHLGMATQARTQSGFLESARLPGSSFRLTGRETRAVQADGSIVDCVAGSCWVTVEGDARDYLLRSGESLAVRRGRVVVQAVGEASVSVNRQGN